MKKQFVNILTALALLSTFAGAQQPADPSPVNPANVMVWGGACFGQDGTGTFSIYRKQTDTVPVWQETQPLTGSAMAFVGNASGGLPTSIFSSGDAGWLELVCNGDTVNVQPRRALTAAPYAMSAADSANLGGRPASDYALASQVNSDMSKDHLNSEISRAQQAEANLSQAISDESTGRQSAISAVQLNAVATASQLAAMNAAMVTMQTQIAALQATNDALASQIKTLQTQPDPTAAASSTPTAPTVARLQKTALVTAARASRAAR